MELGLGEGGVRIRLPDGRPVFERRHIRKEDGSMYMRRWCLNLPWGCSLRVHRFHQADELFHDHPFDFAAVAVWGGGLELLGVPMANYARRVRLFVPRLYKAEDSHCVTRCEGMWTLVAAGRYRRDWRFNIPGRGWVPWREVDKWNTYDHEKG